MVLFCFTVPKGPIGTVIGHTSPNHSDNSFYVCLFGDLPWHSNVLSGASPLVWVMEDLGLFAWASSILNPKP